MLRHLTSRLSTSTNRYLSNNRYLSTNLSSLDLHFNRESLQETVSAVFPNVSITLPPVGSKLRLSDIQTDDPAVVEFITSYYGQFTDRVIPLGVPVGSLHRKVYTPDALNRILKGGRAYKWAELVNDGLYVVAQKEHMASYSKKAEELLPVIQSVTSLKLDKPATPCPVVDKIRSSFNGRVVIEEVEGSWVVTGCEKDVKLVSILCQGLEVYRNASVRSSLHDLDIHQLTASKFQFQPLVFSDICVNTLVL